MGPDELRFRQIHLDFHTSGQIAGVGDDFDADRFADTLARAGVDSATCFARCHHGYLYYDSPAFGERRHPHLPDGLNLLGEQIAACHARGIRVPIYTTVMADHFSAEEHPEWRRVDADGRWYGPPPYEPGFWQLLCLNTPYVDFLKAHVLELLTSLPVDGLFFDIVHDQDCSCVRCRRAMEAAGIDPSDEAARQAFGRRVVADFMGDMTALVQEHDRDCTIFYNAGHVGPGMRPLEGCFSHFELESLPSGWGYTHFPVAMRYARTLGKPCVGMTGKFHTVWGDFHSYKNLPALQFECFNMLALGAGCSVGDQLYPSGRLDGPTYDLIGQVYHEVQAKEPWCRGARPVVEIGVLSDQGARQMGMGDAGLPAWEIGAARMFQELALQFDFIDAEADWSAYRLIVLPDETRLDDARARKLESYLAGGGSVLASARAGLNPQGDGFALDALGVAYEGDAPFSPDFLMSRGAIGEGLPAVEHVMYLRGVKVAPLPGAEVLAEVMAPHFNRTWRHFTSHAHAPSTGKPAYPGVVRSGRAVYFAHPVFTQYQQNAPLWVKRMVGNALGVLLGEPLVRLDAPSTAVATLNDQPHEGRYVLHLLHYIPERRAQAFDVIEDVIPLHALGVSLGLPRPIAAVRCVPDGAELPFSIADGRTEFILPRLDGHQMIELRYI